MAKQHSKKRRQMSAKTCKTLFNSKKSQQVMNQAYKDIVVPHMLQLYGTLPKNAYNDYKKGYKKAFLRSCQGKAPTKHSASITKKLRLHSLSNKADTFFNKNM